MGGGGLPCVHRRRYRTRLLIQRCMVCHRLGAGFGRELAWTPGPAPTLCRLHALARVPVFGGLDCRPAAILLSADGARGGRRELIGGGRGPG